MSILQSIILGIIQGLTEFLPVSSSGHLILMPKIFGWTDQGLAFDAVMHLATGLAILVALSSDIFSKQVWGNKRLWLMFVLAVVPAGLAGYFFGAAMEKNFRSAELVAINLIFWGVVLGVAEKIGKRYKNKTAEFVQIKPRQAALVGFTQIIAFLPGVSRSGITITAGLCSRMEKSLAVKFSFLAGLPLVLAAGLKKIYDLSDQGENLIGNGSIIYGFVAAFVSGIMAIKLLNWVAEKSDFKWFVVYRIALGIIILCLW